MSKEDIVSDFVLSNNRVFPLSCKGITLYSAKRAEKPDKSVLCRWFNRDS